MKKIINLNELSDLIKQLRGERTVLVGGVFDILHIGHVRFLSESKKLGDRLVVLLESDEKVKQTKGMHRPIHRQNERAEVLSNMACVDYIVLLPLLKNDTDYQTITKSIHPHTIALTGGDPYKKQKQIQADTVGAQLVEIPKIDTPSTTQLAQLLKLENV